MTAATEKCTGSSLENPGSVPSAATPALTRIRVWLTDDNAGFRDALALLLAPAGEFDCERQFHSAESLLEGLATEPAPDVILLDVEMGGITGVDALRLIRALAANVRVLIITSLFDPLYAAQASRDGASAFLIKADTPKNLTGEIHRALASPIKMMKTAGPSKTPDCGLGRITRQPPVSQLALPKNLITRPTSWVVKLSAALSGLVHYHRPTPSTRLKLLP